MQTDSSASRTYFASASASECTTTVLMPSSRHARCTRSAISPRLAIRTLSKSWPATLAGIPDSLKAHASAPTAAARGHSLDYGSPPSPSADDDERLTVFDGLPVFDQDRFHGARLVGLDLVHQLHSLDN